jgi:uncharacterized protein
MTKILIILIFLLFIACTIWACWIEPSRIKFVTHTIHIKGWPASLAAYKIAFLTDPHVGGLHIKLPVMRGIVENTNRLKPDMILLGGDYVTHNRIRIMPHKPSLSMQVAKILSELHAPDGVFAVLGNHDWRSGGKRMQDEMTAEHIRMLENDAIYIRSKESGFWIAGISDHYEGKHDVASVMKPVSGNSPIIAFTHTPDVFPELPDTVSLTLAGHTHGGQIHIPFIGSPFIPSLYGQRYAKGLITEGDKQLFVSHGIGTSVVPVRFMAPPEVSIITIYPADSVN